MQRKNPFMWESGEELSLSLLLFLSTHDVTLDQHDKNKSLVFCQDGACVLPTAGCWWFLEPWCKPRTGGFLQRSWHNLFIMEASAWTVTCHDHLMVIRQEAILPTKKKGSQA